jgi:alpha-mannosidase
VLAVDAGANRLALYEDDGDAWDFPQDYRQRARGYPGLASMEPGMDGPFAWMDQEYRVGHSVLRLRVSLVAGSARLSFAVQARWRERGTMLRVSFPLAVHSPEATCGIAFGAIRRPTHSNTSWDRAKEEVPCHGWADVSRRDRGVALLADGTYGYRLKDGALELALIRSVRYPGPVLVRDADVKPGAPHHGFTDQGDHVFSYALFPHPGDHVAGKVVREACAMASPVRTVAVHGAPPIARTPAPAAGSFFAVDAENVILETVKPAEDGDGIVLRFYESAGAGATARVTLPGAADSVVETDLLEARGRKLRTKDGSFSLSFGPYEIKTVKVVLRSRRGGTP